MSSRGWIARLDSFSWRQVGTGKVVGAGGGGWREKLEGLLSRLPRSERRISVGGSQLLESQNPRFFFIMKL